MVDKEKNEPKVPAWVKTWAKRRAKGLCAHLRPQILSDDELLGDLVEDIVDDEDALAKLEAMGYKVTKIKE